jgi:hypothetical protein
MAIMKRVLGVFLCVSVAGLAGCGATSDVATFDVTAPVPSYAELPEYDLSEPDSGCPVLLDADRDLMEGCSSPGTDPLGMYVEEPRGLFLLGPFPVSGVTVDDPARVLESTEHYILIQVPVGTDYRTIVIRVPWNGARLECAMGDFYFVRCDRP